MALSKKHDPARKLRSFKRHSFLLIQPIAFALAVTIVWSRIRAAGYHFSKEDENVVLAGITILVLPYGVLVGVILASVWEKYKKVISCVFKNDPETFYQYRDERMPVLLHILSACLATSMLILISGLTYHGTICGAIVVFSAALGFSVIWIVSTELENPAKSAWFAERVPKEWIETDIDAYFEFEKRVLQNN